MLFVYLWCSLRMRNYTLYLYSFASGVLALVYEVLWMRRFALLLGATVPAMAATLSAFFLGMALGSAVLGKRTVHWPRPLRAYGVLQLGIAAGALLVEPILRLYDHNYHSMYSLFSGFPAMFLAGKITLSMIAIFLPTFLMGGTLPALAQAIAADLGRLGVRAGGLYAVNTLGATLGALSVPFVILPSLGVDWGYLAAIAGSLVLGGTAWFLDAEPVERDATIRSKSSRKPVDANDTRLSWPLHRRLGAYALLGLGVWLLNPGGLLLVRMNQDKGERLVSVEEGSYGAVAVLEDNDHRWMTINNYYVLGGTSSVRDERMQAHLPLFLHPAPKKVAFLGLGTGITAGAALLHPVDSLVALEIVPEVIRAARYSFADANLHVFEDPRMQVRAEDARNFLKGSGRKFDVIVGDLVVPWRPGESSLLSQEHFYATRDDLLPGGIFCQWLPLFQLSEEGFNIIAATFLQVYPKSVLWRGDFLADQPAIALIGQRDPAPLDVAAIDQRVRNWTRRVDDPNPYLADPAGFWLFLVGQLNRRDPSYASARHNQDSRPWLELLTPAAHFSRSRQGDPVPPGRTLTALFEEMRTQDLQGSLLEQLDADHLRWRDAGGELWEASILAAEGRDEEAQARALETLATLPASLQNAVLGKELRSSGPIPLPGH